MSIPGAVTSTERPCGLVSRPGASEYLAIYRLAERFAYVAKGTGDVIWDRDVDAGVVWCNENVKAVFGLSAGEVAANPDWCAGRIHADDRERYLALIQAFLQGAVPSWSVEARFRVTDGIYRYFLSRGFPVRKDGERVARFIGLMTDVNDQRVAERERDQLFRLSLDPMCIGTHTGRFLRVNPAWEKAFGFTQAEVQQMNLLDAVLPADRGAALVELQKRTAGNPTFDLECRFLCKDGSYKCFLWSATSDGPEGLAFVVGKDITQRKEAEQKLNLTLADLGRSNQELEQFAYVASHDLQEPLRMVSSYTQLLAQRYQGRLDASADEFIAFAVDGANRMQGLINDLLTYSRVGKRSTALELTDCSSVLDQALANLKGAIEESGAVVTRGPLPAVMADSVLLAQLFQNLIGNAIKFRVDQPPRIHVSAEQKGAEWIFAVRDNGIGMDPQYAGRIFIIFERLHTREEYPGTGIGLAICKKIVERRGGRIWVESQLGKGSTFYFTIPLGGDGL